MPINVIFNFKIPESMSNKSVSFRRLKRMSAAGLLDLACTRTFNHYEATIFAKVMEMKCPTPTKRLNEFTVLSKAA